MRGAGSGLREVRRVTSHDGLDLYVVVCHVISAGSAGGGVCGQ